MQASLENLKVGFDKLRKRLKRRFGDIEYVRVYEEHESGAIHLHALISADFGDYKQRPDGSWYSPWLAKQAKQLGLGWRTHAELATGNPAQVATYIGKYMTKQSKSFAALTKKTKRIATTQGFAKAEADNEYQWVVRSLITDDDLFRDGRPWLDLTTKSQITLDDFTDGEIYPPLSDYDD